MYDQNKEVSEAIRAGERALSSLREAESCLQNAGGWGMVDMFGGNILSGMMKHSNLNRAQQALDRAKWDLQSFQRELGDVQNLNGMDIGISDFLTFADFFFDGILADVLVQSKISEAKQQVREAIRRVEEMLGRLRSFG